MSKTSRWEYSAFSIAFLFLCAMVSSCAGRYYPEAPRYVGYELK